MPRRHCCCLTGTKREPTSRRPHDEVNGSRHRRNGTNRQVHYRFRRQEAFLDQKRCATARLVQIWVDSHKAVGPPPTSVRPRFEPGQANRRFETGEYSNQQRRNANRMNRNGSGRTFQQDGARFVNVRLIREFGTGDRILPSSFDSRLPATVFASWQKESAS